MTDCRAALQELVRLLENQPKEDALKWWGHLFVGVEAARAALALPVPEPVAYGDPRTIAGFSSGALAYVSVRRARDEYQQPLYALPGDIERDAARQRVIDAAVELVAADDLWDHTSNEAPEAPALRERLINCQLALTLAVESMHATIDAALAKP